jgi:molybdopterin molybdotransferase
VTEATAPGSNIRPAGIDFTAGMIGLRRGRRLAARDIGLAAAMNHPWIPVHRRPRIAILATGDEVVLPGEPLGADQIIGSNGPAIAALVRAAGGLPTLLPVAADDPDALAAAFRAAAGADLLVTIGGASEGDHDLVARLLREGGMTLEFWKIAMRPGKPLLFGARGDLPILGLPGNPVSALVTGLIFLRPAIETLQGLAVQDEIPEIAIAAAPLPANGIRQDYVRASLTPTADGGWQACPLASQDSSLTSLLAAADGLIIRPPHAEALPAGSAVPIIRLGSF